MAGVVTPSRRVLVVEDDVDLAELFRTLLEGAGHEVGVAHDGRSAVELARTFRPDVAVLDLGLPDIDGFATFAALRAIDGLGTLRAVAVTGQVSTEMRDRAITAGFRTVLFKPCEPQLLLRMVRG
jgi:CheY-like chemotaxis protein